VAENKPLADLRSAGSASGEVFGGLAAVLVALPSAIAYGLVIYGPLGPEFSGTAVVAGIAGTIFIGLMAALLGGTPGLISALIPQVLALTAVLAGIMQLLTGALGGGRLIKYIPYPVVAGYLSGVGLLIIIGQVPKFFGYPKALHLWQGLSSPASWHWESLVVGGVTVLAMLLAPKVVRKIPAAICALAAGIASYFVLSIAVPELRVLEHNKLVIGAIQASAADLAASLTTHWAGLAAIPLAQYAAILVPAATLAVLLSIDTLKTCVVLDVMTGARHDSNKELTAQGVGNIVSAAFCGMPGAGTMGATLVNLTSGGRTKASGVLEAAFGVAILLLLGKFIAWIPLASLAGILIVVGFRMIDVKSVHFIRHRSTRLDFFVILAVIVSALSFSLLVASGVGIAMAIILFLREQVQTSVVRRKLDGTQIFSKKRRLADELEILGRQGHLTTVCELQGQLFFGTADQLYTELEKTTVASRTIIIDMKRVRSIDYTAVNMLKQIYRKVREHSGVLIFSSIPASLPTGLNMRKYFKYLGLAEDDEGLMFFPELDPALEWAEDALLAANNVRRESKLLDLKDFDLFRGMPQDVLSDILKSMDSREFPAGEKISSQGDLTDEVYFIRSGTVKIGLPLAGGAYHYLATFQQGDLFGEMSFLDKQKRSADATAATAVSLYILSRQRFNDIATAHPETGSVLFARLAKELSLRLRQNHVELKTLEEN
jgi:SulP family sulfate permease